MSQVKTGAMADLRQSDQEPAEPAGLSVGRQPLAKPALAGQPVTNRQPKPPTGHICKTCGALFPPGISHCRKFCDKCRKQRARDYRAAYSRQRQRQRRKPPVIISGNELTLGEKAAGAKLSGYRAGSGLAGLTRGDCQGGRRPCPFVSCRYHLYLDQLAGGAIRLNFPDLAVSELKETCALDVADYGGLTFTEIGEILNLTHERIRQVEARGLRQFREGFRKLKKRG